MASTTGIESWAVDLAEVGPIYPFQGSEMILALVGIGLWVCWHVVQLTAERREAAERAKRYGDRETVEQVVDKHGD